MVVNRITTQCFYGFVAGLAVALLIVLSSSFASVAGAGLKSGSSGHDNVPAQPVRNVGSQKAFEAPQHRGPMERCTLHWMSGMVRLFTMVRVTDTLLLEHFLKHYHSLGVQLDKYAHFVLQKGDTPRSASDNCLRILRRYNISDYVFVQHYSSKLKTQLVNEYLLTMPRNIFVLYPDIDEFFDFPCDLQERVSQGIHAFWGKMADRFGPGFTIPTLKATPDIHEQFPISCPDMRANMSTAPKRYGTHRHRPLKTTKLMLFMARVRTQWAQFLSSHTLALYANNHRGNPNLSFVKKVSYTEISNLGFFAHFAYAGSDVLQKWKNKQAQASVTLAQQRDYMEEYLHVGESGIELTQEGLDLAMDLCVET